MKKCLVNLPGVIQNGGRCDIFECLFGLKPIHVKIYFYILKQKRTIKEISTHVDRDRTTTVRLLQSMETQGILNKEIETLPYGGIRNTYRGIPQEQIKNRLQRTVKEVESAVDQLINQDWENMPE
ncbi:MAG: helix-turn-helix domain-containing protein [Candidatus Heimdallarchaeaceae archaeon]|jgi:predicted transcriptional regulator